MTGTTTEVSPELDELGPIDFIVVEWPGRQPQGDAIPALLDLVDRGLVRILDFALMAKDEDGTVGALDLAELGPDSPYAEMEGASSGLVRQADIDAAAEALAPGSAAAILIWENHWAVPFAAAVRRGGGQLVASGRLALEDVVTALDELDAAER